MTGKPKRRSVANRNGSGLRVLMLAGTAFVAFCLLATSTFASKEVVDYFGGNGGGGGEFNGSSSSAPRGVAVDATGAGPANPGDIYVADTDNNRVQRFDADDNFISAWGADVVASGGSGDHGDATAKDYEICTVASECKRGVESGGNGNGAGNGDLSSPQGIAVDEDTGDVFVSDAGNHRINVYDGVGNFLYAIGRDVAEPDGGAALEVCQGATGICRTADTGSGAGEIGQTSAAGALGIAVSPPDGNVATGAIYLADTGNQRVDTYDLDGSNPSSFGSSADFRPGQPRKVAVDSRGIVYASNSKLGGEIERYDSLDANGGGVGFLAPIGAATDNANETQSLAFSGFSSGDTFTLSCPGGATTNPIVWNTDGSLSSRIQSALEAKCGSGFAVSFVPVITFQGAFAHTNVPTTVCATVTGAGTCGVTEESDGTAAAPGLLLAGDAATVTVGLQVAPDPDGGAPNDGSEEDILYVLRDANDQSAAVQQLGPSNDPGLVLAPTGADDEHGSGAGLSASPFNVLGGLGLDRASGRLFIPAHGGPPGGISGAVGDFVFILDDSFAPDAILDPVTAVGAHSATFSGSVDPNGFPTVYRFEYVDDAEFSANGFANAEQAPIADASAGNGNDPIAVEQELPHHLTAGTTYHVRLVAKQRFSPSTQSIGGPLTFTTASSTPSLKADATGIETDNSTLRGAINPQNRVVSDYHFNWGTSDSYGNTTTVHSLPLGSAPVAVAEQLTGLAPGTTYHYQLVATNATGAATGPDQTFTTPAAPPQFPQRGYEIASPYPTGGSPLIEVTGHNSASENGDRLAFEASNPFPGSTTPPLQGQQHGAGSGAGANNLPQYLSERGSGSWQFNDVGIMGEGWSADLKRLLTLTDANALGSGGKYEDPRVDPEDQNKSEDAYERLPDGSLVWISRDPRIPAGTPQTAMGNVAIPADPGPSAMSADGRIVVFSSQRQLLDADTTPQSGFSAPLRLYKWEDGQLSFIGKRPDGSVPAGGSALGDRPEFTSARYAVSRDGSRVVFSAQRVDGVGGGVSSDGTDGVGIYVQRDGQPTVEATKETGVAPLPVGQPYKVTYRGAAADDSRVFFTSASRFTPDSGAMYTESSDHQGDLYVYDLAADKVRDLTPRLDGIDDPSIDPAAADRAGVLGVAANSEDGKRVYFVANAQYPTAPNPNGDLPSASGRNLYMAELDGIDDPVKLRFIGSLGAGDGPVWQAGWDGKTALASPDGSTLGFGAAQNLVAGRATGGTTQLYAYDAERGRLDCASCPADGSLPVEYVNKFDLGDQQGADWQGSLTVRRWVASDGTVFFHTATPLLPADENVVRDVYEFRDGALQLITTGTGTTQSRFSNASVDGSTVFFNTLEALAPQDKEPGVPKAYAARVGGGFPYAPPPPGCDFNAGACEGAGTGALGQPGAGTAAFAGPGDPKPKFEKGCPKGKRKVRSKDGVRCQKRPHRATHAKRHHKRTAKHNRRAGR